jgi:uncharacterized surface protein with fasciclin (FAS1) repeats
MQKTKTENGGDLMDLVSKQPHLTKFNQAIKSAGLTEKFLGPANYTVFAPTDEAFNKLPQDRVNNLLQPENREQLKNLVLLHVVPGSFKIDDLKKAAALKTEAGREVKVAVSQDAKEIKIGNARVTHQSEDANNWRLYLVDAVLQPTAGAAAAG